MKIARTSALRVLLLVTGVGCVGVKPSIPGDRPLDLTNVIWLGFGNVRSVRSADTVVVDDSHQGQVVLRLSGVEAPAEADAWCVEARERLRELVQGKRILYYKNPIQHEAGVVNASLQVDARDVNEHILRAGWARYRDDGAFAEKYKAIADEAQAERRGLWGGEPRGSRPNTRVNAPVRPITALANYASAAPVRPARYARR